MKPLIMALLLCSAWASPVWSQQAIVNEFASDPTMYDGQGGEFIELYCPIGGGACDISCWVLTDGEGLVTIPQGTQIPAGGYYLMGYAPAINCPTCDFYGITLDLDWSACNGCLSGGNYGTAYDGNPTVIFGKGGNSGEVLYFYDNTGTLREALKFDNADGMATTPMATGGTISAYANNGCGVTSIHIPNPNNIAVINTGVAVVGCNTSYARATDGSNTWTTQNHPTPRATNANGGTNAFMYEYQVDGGAWRTITPTSTTGNAQTGSLTLCSGSNIQFRISVRNFQHVLATQYDAVGRIGSFFESTQTGRVDWTLQGGGNVNGEYAYLVSPTMTLPSGASNYTLQWSDYKQGLGSTTGTTSNDCYEYMTLAISREDSIQAAIVQCSDPVTGSNSIITTPATLRNATYYLYDDAGTRTNLIRTSTSNNFSLTTAAAPTVDYYVIVSTACNSITATESSNAYCRADAPCPQIATDVVQKNGTTQTTTFTACPSDALTLTVNGTNLPGGGKIRWYRHTVAGFNPYSGQGTLMGEVTIPPVPACSSATTRLNEIMYRPSSSNGVSPNTGEYIELIGMPYANIGCMVLTDGDWAITIPAGTQIPADGIFTVGNNSIYGAGTFDIDARNCGCFTEVSGSLLVLTDGGEYVSLFNSTGTFAHGVVYGAPTATNTPPNGQLTMPISIPARVGCPATTITIPSTGFETAPAVAAIGTSLEATPDGSGTWAGRAGGSLNRCNSSTTVAMPSLTYNLGLSDCNQTIYMKAIVEPHPNTASCPNTAASAYSREYQVNLTCPTATLTTPSTSICNNAAPITASITTAGIANGTNVTIQYTRNGAIQSTTGTVNSNAVTFPISQTGTYALSSITATGICAAVGTGSTNLEIVPVPSVPVTPASVEACTGMPITLVASGASLYDWAYVSDFSVVQARAEDFTTSAPNTVYVRSVNDNVPPAATCVSAAKSIALTSKSCPNTTFPLTWLGIQAEPKEKNILVTWQTGSELNTHYFDVERSADGVSFDKIGQVAAAGNSSTARSYQWLDTRAAQGWNYYRIRETDIDGTQSLSQTVAVLVEGEKTYCTIYPNPIQNNSLQIAFFDDVLPNSRLYVYNGLGQLVLQQDLNAERRLYVLDTHAWASGAYIIQIQTNTHSYTKKVIKP